MHPLPPRLSRISALLCLLTLSLGTGRADLVRVANTTLNLPADLPSATGYTTSNALGSLTFSTPICTTYPAGETNRLYVVQRGGIIRVVNNLSTTPSAANFMNLAAFLASPPAPRPSTPLQTGSENGLLSMVFHPNYNQNGYFYLYYSIAISGQLHQRLARFQATDPDLNPATDNYNDATSADPATEFPLLTLHDVAGNHNGGDLAFGADGYLYISLGDEGGGNDQYNNARFINDDFWGQMLRLDVDNNPSNLLPNAHSQPGPHPSAVHAGTYRIPADNPFNGYTSWHGVAISPSTVRTEIYATGLRNPFRFTIDPATGRIFLGDVGQGTYEEMNIIEKGGDYGWSWREGFHAFSNPPAPTTPPAGYASFRKDPIYEYDHTNDGSGNDAVIFGTSVCGGIIYRGNQLPELQGKLIFSDIFGGGGIIAALTETSTGTWTGQRLTVRAQIADFGTDPRNGEPLLCSLLGTIYRITRTGTDPGDPAPPATLSATGAFSDLATLTPNAGIVPYQPNVDFWSDYAQKSRWFSIKNTTDTMTWSAAGNWTFPTGMVWIKHFDIETTRGVPATRRRLETRFLVKTASSVYGLSYRWRADQTDADLVVEQGMSEVIPSSSPAQTWRYPSRAECVTCHSAVAGHALSFNTPQMNRAHDYGGTSQNQIEALSNAGYFEDPATGIGGLPAFARADDAGASLEWRVRSYLSVNCVQCHQPGGASQGYWDARHTTPLESANIVNALLLNSGGDSDNRFIVPADTGHSMLLKRQRGDGVPRMPPLATTERDLAAEQLVSDWINSLAPLENGVLAIDVPAGSTILVNEEVGTVQIPIIRTDGDDGTVGFTITTVNGNATAGTDFTPPVSTHALGDGVTTLNVPITLLNPPSSNEAHESFTVTISAPTGGATLGPVTSVTVRIMDSFDTTAPTAPVITFPAATLVGVDSNAALEITGTARDNKDVNSVKVRLNSGPFEDASLTAPDTTSTGWSHEVTPVTGSNTITVQSFDRRNNASTQVVRSFTVTRRLTVAAEPLEGSVTAGYSPGSYRQVGQSITLTATPRAPTTSPAFDGTLFAGWTFDGADIANGNVPFTMLRLGIVASALEKQTLTFIFREGLALTANFVPNPFASQTGTYHGLISPSPTLPDRAPLGGSPGPEDGSARTNATEGRFTATVQNTGAFSATLTIDGLTLSVNGAFDASGNARFGTARLPTATVARTGKPSLIVALQLAGQKVTGTVTARDFKQSVVAAVSTVDSERAFYRTTGPTVDAYYLGANPAIHNGTFTVIFPANDQNETPDFATEDYPQGCGTGTLTITKGGVITLTGTLADGATVTASSALSASDAFPLFAQLYNRQGFLSGMASLDKNATDSDLASPGLHWVRPSQNTHYYPFGWPHGIVVEMLGAKYVVIANQSVLRAAGGLPLPGADADGNVRLHFSNAQLSEALVKSANVSLADIVTKVPSNDGTFTLSITRTSGTFTGIFNHTDDTRPVFNGILYQKGAPAGGHGFFLTRQPVPIDYTGESGGVKLIAEP